MKSLAPKRANKTRDHKAKISSRPTSVINSRNNSNHNSDDEHAI
jgi:hypothetical protein